MGDFFRDVLIVDDQIEWMDRISRIVMPLGFIPVEFTDFYEALSYLGEGERVPYAYFVDMKPIPILPESLDLSDPKWDLLQTPERIFYAAKAKGSIERFCFISANLSDHDDIVLRRTGARFIQKDYLSKDIRRILKDE